MFFCLSLSPILCVTICDGSFFGDKSRNPLQKNSILHDILARFSGGAIITFYSVQVVCISVVRCGVRAGEGCVCMAVRSLVSRLCK